MKKLFFLLLICGGLAAAWLYATPPDHYPALKDGDLVFQTSTSDQSGAILVATAHPFTHMGVVKTGANGAVVLEAASRVTATPVTEWFNRGLLKRVAIYRDPELTPEQAKRVIAAAESLIGRPYDIFFSFSNESIYCSELAWLSYRSAGLDIGKIQKVSELHFDNPPVKSVIEKRWRRHPECVEKGYQFEQCYALILNQPLVTPASIAADPKFQKIYSNYPF